MHSSFTTSVYLLALLLPLATSLSIPWKRESRNLNGPSSRGKWDGEHDIDTDMDLAWPVTGRTVKVYHFISLWMLF